MKKTEKKLRKILAKIDEAILDLEEERDYYYIRQFIPSAENKVEQIDRTLILIRRYRDKLYNIILFEV